MSCWRLWSHRFPSEHTCSHHDSWPESKTCPLSNQFTERVLSSFCPVLHEVGAAFTALVNHRLADYCFISAWKNPNWKQTILKLLGTWLSILAKNHFIGWMPSRKRLIFYLVLSVPLSLLSRLIFSFYINFPIKCLVNKVLLFGLKFFQSFFLTCSLVICFWAWLLGLIVSMRPNAEPDACFWSFVISLDLDRIIVLA